MLFKTIPQGFPATGWVWSVTVLSINTPATCSGTFSSVRLNPLIRNCSSKSLNMCISPSLFSLLFGHMLTCSAHLQIWLKAARLLFCWLGLWNTSWHHILFLSSLIVTCLSLPFPRTFLLWKALCGRLQPDIRSWKNHICLWARVLSCFPYKLECEKITERFFHQGEFLMPFPPNNSAWWYHSVPCSMIIPFCAVVFVSPLSHLWDDVGAACDALSTF